MTKKTEKLLDIIQRSYSVEKVIIPNVPDRTGLIDELHDINSEFDELLQELDEDGVDNSRLIELLEISKQSNDMRVRILKELDEAADTTYTEYRHDNESLLGLLKKRSDLVADVDEGNYKTQLMLQEGLTAYMYAEDAALMKLLIAMSNVDGHVHKKEVKIIKKNFEKITLHPAEDDELKDSFKTIDAELETILEMLENDSSKLSDEVKQMMFYEVMNVAIADNHFKDLEKSLLLRLANILHVSNEDGEEISSIDDIKAILAKSRRIK